MYRLAGKMNYAVAVYWDGHVGYWMGTENGGWSAWINDNGKIYYLARKVTREEARKVIQDFWERPSL